MPQKQDLEDNGTPIGIRYLALVAFIVIILYKLIINKEDIPEWYLFVLIVMVAGGDGLDTLVKNIVKRIMGGGK